MPPSQAIKIYLNGEEILIEDIALMALLNKLNLENKRFAVEVNQLSVPRSEHHSYILANNDRVEIVEAVGGG